MSSFHLSNDRQLESAVEGGRAPVWIHLVGAEDVSGLGLGLWMGARGFRTRLHPSAEALVAAAPGLEPGCVILDLAGPVSSAVEVIDRLCVAAPDHPVVVCGCGDVALAVTAMKLGAADVLDNPGWGALADAVSRALEAAARRSAALSASAPSVVRVSALTPRQRDVLRGVMAGKLNKSIAHQLGLSVRTVEAHRAAMMIRTGARSLSDLIRMAIAAGL